jgi:hypothetical protein
VVVIARSKPIGGTSIREQSFCRAAIEGRDSNLAIQSRARKSI